MLLVIPSLWLLSASGAWRVVPLLAAIGVALSAGIVGMLLWALGWPNAMPITIALSWIPLWGALLFALRSPNAPANATTGDGRTSRSRRPRK